MRGRPRNLQVHGTALLLSSGCMAEIYKDGIAEFATHSGPGSSGEPVTPTGGTDAGVQTATGGPDSELTGGDTDPPPTIELFVADPPQLSEAGTTQLVLITSDDVVSVALTLGDGSPTMLKPGDFPRSYEVFSEEDNVEHVFKVVVSDREGQTATADTELTVLVPASGNERCTFADTGATGSVAGALLYTADSLVAAGWRDAEGSGQRMTVWKLDRDTCEVQAGWPRTIDQWTKQPQLAAEPSSAVALAADAAGYIVVGGNLLLAGGVPQRYTALLTPEGSLVWEKAGAPGQELAGVAAANRPQNTVFVVGSERTSNNPIRTDARVWGLQAVGVEVNEWEATLKAPLTADEPEDPNNVRSERLLAVAVESDNSTAIAVGEREFLGKDFVVYRRTFTARYHSLGEPAGDPWTSTGDFLPHDSARALGWCDGQLVAGGWTHEEMPNPVMQPLIRWIEPDGSSTERHSEPLPGTQLNGVACDRQGKILSAGLQFTGDFDAKLYASDDPKEPPIWYELGDAGTDAYFAVQCEVDRGFCAGGGFRTANNKSHAFVRVYHP